MDVNQSLMIEAVKRLNMHGRKQMICLKTYDQRALWKNMKRVQKMQVTEEWIGFIEFFIESAKKNEAPAIDVYDAATWLSITALSEEKVFIGQYTGSYT